MAKPEFDPNKPFETVKPQFDPNQAFEAGQPISQLESGLRGAAEGATFGFAPAISGAAQALPTALQAATGGASMQDILNKYNAAREASKGEFEAAQKANPWTYGAGTLAGGLAPALLTGGASEVATGAEALSPVMSAATTGLKMGALAGTGEAVSSGKDLGGIAEGAIEGGAGGAILGGAMGKLGGALQAAPEALEEFGAARALKSTGIGKAQMKRLIQEDVRRGAYSEAAPGEAEVESNIQKMGKLLVEKNPYQDTPVVTAGATAEDILERSHDLSQKSGQAIGDILKSFDSIYSQENPQIMENFVNPADIAKEVETQLLKPLMVNGAVSKVSEPVATTINNVLDTINQYGNAPIPFQKAQELKQLITGLANYETPGSAANQVLRRAGGIINKEIEDSADAVVGAVGKPELMDEYKNAKDLYKTAMTAKNAATGKTAGEAVNRDFGISDYMAAGMGLAAHSSPVGILTAAGNKLGRTYGNPVMATGASKLSNIYKGLSNTLTDMKQDQLAQFGQHLVSQESPLAKSLGNVLTGISEKDDIGKNAMIYALMQNSGYRNLLKSYLGSSEEAKK